ncbi:hypothetical protein ABVT39_001570 [Epinephelus coioides]
MLTYGLKTKEKDHPDYIPSLFPARKTQSAAAKLHQAVLSDVPTAPVPETTPPDAPIPATTAPEAPCLPQSVENEIFNLRRERDEARKEQDEAVQQLEKINLFANSVRENDIKCKLMTGLTWTLFDTLHQYLVQFVKPQETSKHSTQDELFITLVKLRQNPSTDFIERIRNTVPAEVLLQYSRLTSIINYFEIRIQHSKKLKTRAMTYSKYKNWTTVKYFIACHPSGAITYISKGWGGRASDVHIVRNSDFLSQRYLHAGDQILADRGFTLREDFAVLERVIGALKSRFHILDGPIPLQLVKRLRDERQKRDKAMIDQILHRYFISFSAALLLHTLSPCLCCLSPLPAMLLPAMPPLVPPDVPLSDGITSDRNRKVSDDDSL